ncbi:4293_t:CDS:2 [Paraglomus occultum]|uniref:4293_t:CDS:1 n=1 Tax=Paraglomus occultum TaxID=144539 RepID=A0A9N9BM06_9GLOM|nr:4293_t:CDS:2 [Paraglomus occultum]
MPAVLSTLMDYKSLLLDDIKNLLRPDSNFDVSISAGRDLARQTFRAHKFILSLRSPFFRKQLVEREMEENEGIAEYTGDPCTFNFEDISPPVFDVVLQYIYTGILQIQNLTDRMGVFLELVSITHTLELDHPCKYAQAYTQRKYETELKAEFVRVKNFCQKHRNLSILQKFVDRTILGNNPDVVFDAVDLNKLDRPTLEKIVRRPDLLTPEIKIWDKVLEWAKAQSPSLPKNAEDFSNDDFIELGKRLEPFLPYIYIRQVQPKDFFHSVQPYQESLPKDYYNKNLKFFLDTESRDVQQHRLGFDSKLLNRTRCAAIVNWIDSESFNNDPSSTRYALKLIYRASNDGFNDTDFHRLCDNKGPTVVVIRVKETGEILGGYNPLSWDKTNQYKATDKSFLFNLITIEETEAYRGIPEKRSKLQRFKVIQSDKAIYCGANYGPTFGKGHDLVVFGPGLMARPSHCKKSSYEAQLREGPNTNFVPEEIEVFRVVELNNADWPSVE